MKTIHSCIFQSLRKPSLITFGWRKTLLSTAAQNCLKSCSPENSTIRQLFDKQPSATGSPIQISGWIRSIRIQKTVAFAEICDGSYLSGLQVVIPKSQVQGLSTGASITVQGNLVKSLGKNQDLEFVASHCELLGTSDGLNYPLQKKHHTLEFLREMAHLRARTKTFGALHRIRSQVSQTLHSYFKEKDFLQIHTPVLTSHDCEGGGEVFRVVTEGDNPSFFGNPCFLTVSGQLHLELLSCALGRVYTFGPTFRAEKSQSSRHLAEFWMLEAEMAFARELEDVIAVVEETVKKCAKAVLEKSSAQDIEFLIHRNYSKENSCKRLDNLRQLGTTKFAHISYTEAINTLKKVNHHFQYSVDWDSGLQTEHERYLAEEIFESPVFIINYPRHLKPFYMRVNEDGKTVSCFDLVVPGIGELVGGSLREERLSTLEEQMKNNGLEAQDYQWYLDTRKYGTIPHGGFGLGFERLLQYLCGMENIRDTISLPRYFGHCSY